MSRAVESLTATLNHLMTETWGGVIGFWGLLVAILFKFFVFLGECMAAGAIKKSIDSAMPQIIKLIKEEIAPLKKDVTHLKEVIPQYRQEKHAIEGELKTIKRTIVDDDKEILKDLRILIKKQNENHES